MEPSYGNAQTAKPNGALIVNIIQINAPNVVPWEDP
jgi:hypothetical protein